MDRETIAEASERWAATDRYFSPEARRARAEDDHDCHNIAGEDGCTCMGEEL